MKNVLRPMKLIRGFVKYGEGSCLVQTGNTRVLCVATVEENNIPQFCVEKEQGWVTAEYSMLPRAGDRRTNRNRASSSGRAKEISRLIGRSLRAAVDLKAIGRRTIIIDCDVIQADGGTRTASINGGFVALCEAVKFLLKNKLLDKSPIRDHVGAVSVGIIDGRKILDICAKQDNRADVDMNVVMTGRGKFIEVQATAEQEAFSEQDMREMLKIAAGGIRQIINRQKHLVRI